MKTGEAISLMRSRLTPIVGEREAQAMMRVIMDEVFEEQSHLTKVVFQSDVFLGESVFAHCDKLKTLVLPEGCSLYEAEMNPIRTDGHDVIINSLGNGTYRIVVLSVTGREFCPNGTALIHLTIDGDHHDNVVVSDVVMTSSDLESVSINCVPGIATGISGINSDDTDGEWYNIQGQRVATPQHGIYIRNGRKYSVK